MEESEQAPTSQDATQATSPASKSSQTIQYQELINFQKLSNRTGYRTRLPGFKSSFSISCVASDKLNLQASISHLYSKDNITYSQSCADQTVNTSIHIDTFKYSRCMQVFHQYWLLLLSPYLTNFQQAYLFTVTSEICTAPSIN